MSVMDVIAIISSCLLNLYFGKLSIDIIDYIQSSFEIFEICAKCQLIE